MSKTTERAEAIERLRPYLPVGTTVYTAVRSVSRTGMSRTISCHLIRTDDNGKPYPWNITWLVARILDYRLDDAGNMRVRGAGMDMTFAVVYSLSSAMFPEGHHCTGSTGATPTGRLSKAPRCPSNDHSNDYNVLARRYDQAHPVEYRRREPRPHGRRAPCRPHSLRREARRVDRRPGAEAVAQVPRALGRRLRAEPGPPVSAPDSVCPVCNAQPGKPCTAPTNTSRRPVTWFHLDRPGIPL